MTVVPLAVRSRVDGAVARITLDRPRALNAVTIGMVRELQAALSAAQADRGVRTVVVEGAGDRAFSAGGDIVALRESALAGDGRAATFWREEYALNARISSFPKPVVALMDGIVMGGGIGVAGHASHRLATERLVAAMPEVGIGFAPDVGGTWLLSRAPGELGTHLGLTGGRFGQADALLTGFADHAVTAASGEALVAALARGGNVDDVVATFAVPASAATLSRAWIDECYRFDSVPEIADALAARPEEGAARALAAITAASPTAVAVTLAALRRARTLPSLSACLAQELVVSCAFLRHADFAEGIRAQVVDKDRSPRWAPVATDAEVAAFFAGAA